MRWAALKIVGGLCAALFFSAAASAKTIYYVDAFVYFNSSAAFSLAFKTPPSSSYCGIAETAAASSSAAHELCLALLPQSFEYLNVTYSSPFLVSSGARPYYNYGSGSNTVAGFDMRTAYKSCADNETLDNAGNCVPDTGAQCEMGETGMSETGGRSLDGGSFVGCVAGCEASVKPTFAIRGTDYGEGEYTLTGNACPAGLPPAPPKGDPDGSLECYRTQDGRQICPNSGTGDGEVDDQPYAPDNPPPGECKYYSISGRTHFICNGDANPGPVDPISRERKEPDTQFSQSSVINNQTVINNYGVGSGVRGMPGEGEGGGGGKTTIDYGGTCEGDDCPPEGSCSGDDCPSVTDFGAEELKSREAYREGLEAAVLSAADNAPGQPGFSWWNTGGGACRDINVDLGRYGGVRSLGEHCDAYDAWVRPTLEWFLYALSAILIIRIWYSTIREVN